MSQTLSHEDIRKAMVSFTTGNLLNEKIREKQFAAVENFLSISLDARCGALLVSGPPGTGKTCFVKLAAEKTGAKVNEINCTGVSEETLFHELFKNKCSYFDGLTLLNEDFDEAIRVLCSEKKKTPTVVVLDEADFLVPSNQQLRRSTRSTRTGRKSEFRNCLLGGLLRLATDSRSKIVIIAIVNSMEILDVIAESLRSKKSSGNPERFEDISFPPYTESELKDIIRFRIEATGLNPGDIIDEASMTMCAKKLAHTGGDSRLALDACQRLAAKIESDLEFEKLISPTKRMKLSSPEKKECEVKNLEEWASGDLKRKSRRRKVGSKEDVAEDGSVSTKEVDRLSLGSESTLASLQVTPLSSPALSSATARTSTPKKCRISEMNTILNSAGRNISCNSSMILLKNLISGMPLHQRLVVCVIAALADSGKELSPLNVWSHYNRACDAKHIQPVSDLKEIISHVAAAGILTESAAKKKIRGAGASGKLCLNFSSTELECSVMSSNEDCGLFLLEGFLEYVKEDLQTPKV